MKKSIQLTSDAIDYLLQHGESIDFRLDEDVWQDIGVRDQIEFWEDFSGWDQEPSADSRRAKVEVVRMFKASSFLELFDVIEQELQGIKNSEETLKGLRQWWSEDKEVQTGVLAWQVQLIK